MRYELSATDLMQPGDYIRVREAKCRHIAQIRQKRQIAIGPCVTMGFENSQTIWLQAQELFFEKAASLQELVERYNQWVPRGQELVASVKVKEPAGDIEASIEMRIGGEVIYGLVDRNATSDASQMFWVHFLLTVDQVKKFHTPGAGIVIAITHPAYQQMLVLPEILRQELSQDMD